MDKCMLPEGEISEVSNTVDELRNDLSGKLQINYGKTIADTNSNEVEEEEDDDDDDHNFSEEELLAQMGYAVSEPESSCYYTEEVEADCSKREPVSVPTPDNDMKLVSALKGSREKPKKESRVSWAPDVYDPPPSAERFFLNGLDQNVKVVKTNAAKNKQKGGGKGAGRGKGGKGGNDKKQGKKSSGGKYPNYTEF